jgi:hypothetical protein
MAQKKDKSGKLEEYATGGYVSVKVPALGSPPQTPTAGSADCMLPISDRIAASECVRLIALLVESGTPHSKELAIIVASRLIVIAGDDGPADCAAAAMSYEDLAPWFGLARRLVSERGKP